MAKRRKRKHTGGRAPAYSEYLIKGEKLTKAQKRYNEEVRKAWRRIQTWRKKYGIGRELSLIPKPPTGTGVTRSFRESEKAVKAITWKNYSERIIEIAELDNLLRNILGGISELDEHIHYNDQWTDADRKVWRDYKVSWYNTMYKSVMDYKDQIGEKEFYAKLKDGETWREIVRASHELYEVMPSEGSTVDAAIEFTSDAHEDIYWNKFMWILTSMPRSDMEMREYQQRQDEEDYTRMRYGGRLL